MDATSWPFRIGTVDPLELAADYGTPLYVYDLGRIEQRLRSFRAAFAAVDPRLLYACKANSNLALLRQFKQWGVGLDTVSPWEIQLGLHAGFAAEDILFTPNCVAFAEVEEAVALGVGVNLENLSHLDAFGRRFGSEVPCVVRLKPELEGTEVQDWQRQSKFGIPWTDLDQVEELVQRHHLHLTGLHLHSSSVVLDPEVFDQGLAALFAAAERFERVEWLDCGGGIQPPMVATDPEPDLDGLATVLTRQWSDFAARTGRLLGIAFEPGRFLVADSGVLLTRVNVVKNNGYIDIAGVDTGFHQLLRPMMYGARHPIRNLSNPAGAARTFNVDGCLCEIDHLGVDCLLPEVSEGDVLAIEWVGAYGYAMASQYNGRPRPAEVLVDGDHVRRIRRREHLEDLLATQDELYAPTTPRPVKS